jgi:hypothetical protein
LGRISLFEGQLSGAIFVIFDGGVASVFRGRPLALIRARQEKIIPA